MDLARWFAGHRTLSRRVMSIGGRLGYDDDGETPNTQLVMHAYDGPPVFFEVRGLPKDRQYQADPALWSKSMIMPPSRFPLCLQPVIITIVTNSACPNDAVRRPMRKRLKIALIVLGVIFVGVLCINSPLWQRFRLWQMFKPIVAYGTEAELKIESDSHLAIPVPRNSDPFYWYEAGIDHTDYRSFNVPKQSVRAWLLFVVRSRYPQAELVSGSKSQSYWINDGPHERPWRWKDHYWNIGSLTNAVMYEQRYVFFCGDLTTGRIYISTWSE